MTISLYHTCMKWKNGENSEKWWGGYENTCLGVLEDTKGGIYVQSMIINNWWWSPYFLDEIENFIFMIFRIIGVADVFSLGKSRFYLSKL